MQAAAGGRCKNLPRELGQKVLKWLQCPTSFLWTSPYFDNFRTAAAMAAFVGNHHCVSVINNHVPKENVLYYTKWVFCKSTKRDSQKYGTVVSRKQPFEEQAKLSPELAKPLHNLVMSMNTHPVRWDMARYDFSSRDCLPSHFSFCRIALHFRASPCLLEKITSVRKVLELMSDREFKNRTDVNEVGLPPVLFTFFAPSR